MNARRGRLLQFSLRTLLLMFALASVSCGWWVHRSRQWIRQRHEALERVEVRDISGDVERPSAPGGLWLFGEKGVAQIDVMPEWPKIPTDAEWTRRSELFPEATVIPVPVADPSA